MAAELKPHSLVETEGQLFLGACPLQLRVIYLCQAGKQKLL